MKLKIIFLSTPNLLFLTTVLYKIYDTQTSNLYSLVIPPHVIHDFTDMFRIESLLLKLLQTSSRFVPLRRFFKIGSDAGAMNLNGTVPKDLHGYGQTLGVSMLSSFKRFDLNIVGISIAKRSSQ